MIFGDARSMREMRRNYEANHLYCLRANQAEVLLAGGLRDGREAGLAGGIWVLDVEVKL
jgi:hypothetical protein